MRLSLDMLLVDLLEVVRQTYTRKQSFDKNCRRRQSMGFSGGGSPTISQHLCSIRRSNFSVKVHYLIFFTVLPSFCVAGWHFDRYFVWVRVRVRFSWHGCKNTTI